MADFLAYELFPGILNMSLAASVIIGAVLLARLLLKRAPKGFSYVLWWVVLFRLLCPISISAGISLLGVTQAPAREATRYTTAVEYVRPAPVSGGEAELLPQNQEEPESQLPVMEDTEPSNPSFGAAAIVAVVWLLGGAAMAGYGLWSYRKVRRSLVGALRLRDNIYLADHIPSPFVMGLLRPRIYLPSGLGGQEQEYIICHEQYHIRRKDHMVKVLFFLALCLHWFNPLVWLAFCLMGRDMEMSCDEAVVKSLGGDIRAEYSASLLSLATGHKIIAGTPLAFGEGDAKGRIRNLARWKRPKRWAAALAALVCVSVAAACVANPKEEGPKGQYASMEDFAQQTMAEQKTMAYLTNSGQEGTANVTDTKLSRLEKVGLLEGLAPEGTLEAWIFQYLVQVDAEDILLAGGMYEQDGYFDLEGQGGHNVVALQYPDGSYDILYNEAISDDLSFYGYHDNYTDALYDWYVTEYGLDLPLYVKELLPPDENGNYPADRYNGPDWYLYVPRAALKHWLEQKEDGSIRHVWVSSVGKTVLTLEPVAQSAQDLLNTYRAQGYTVNEELLTAQGEDSMLRLHEAQGGCWLVSTYSAGRSPSWELREAMAESFVLQEGAVISNPQGAAYMKKIMDGVSQEDSLTLTLRQDGEQVGSYDDCLNRSVRMYYFQEFPKVIWSGAEAPEPGEKQLEELPEMTLAEGNDWSITAYRGVEAVRLSCPEGTWWVRAEGEPGFNTYAQMRLWFDPYTWMRQWFDNVEYDALSELYGQQDGVAIPDRGQSYLEAAEEYVQTFEGLHRKASPGSFYCYSFVKTSVQGAQEMTQSLREQGEIGENTYCFEMITVFVPENENAMAHSLAGNTVEYTGHDPDVPAGAWEYGRCGYATLEADGWHCELAGTGW